MAIISSSEAQSYLRGASTAIATTPLAPTTTTSQLLSTDQIIDVLAIAAPVFFAAFGLGGFVTIYKLRQECLKRTFNKKLEALESIPFAKKIRDKVVIDVRSLHRINVFLDFISRLQMGLQVRANQFPSCRISNRVLKGLVKDLKQRISEELYNPNNLADSLCTWDACHLRIKPEVEKIPEEVVRRLIENTDPRLVNSEYEPPSPADHVIVVVDEARERPEPPLSDSSSTISSSDESDESPDSDRAAATPTSAYGRLRGGLLSRHSTPHTSSPDSATEPGSVDRLIESKSSKIKYN